MKGVREALRAVLSADAPAPAMAVVVFLPVMKGDTPEAASAMARSLADPRAVFLWDPDRAVGRALLGPLGLRDAPGFAWDTYCLYAPGTEWTGAPPTPSHWLHQMGGVDPAHARPGRVGEDVRAWFATSTRDR